MKIFLPGLLGLALLGGLSFVHPSIYSSMHFSIRPAEGASKNGVASFAPSGTAADNAEFKIVFDEAVAAKDEIGKTLSVSDFPFVTTPPIQAEGKWLDPHTFSASLLAPLETATAYSVTVREGLKSQKGRLIGEGAAFAFQTAPLRLLNVAAAGTREGEVDIQLDFNIPV
ncbi:MAG: Ig-like domain-containing protein, partial [Holosporaceae bacterium]|nr:Ig-like domain-containing protein [Holosporaceae bacterium]